MWKDDIYNRAKCYALATDRQTDLQTRSQWIIETFLLRKPLPEKIPLFCEWPLVGNRPGQTDRRTDWIIETALLRQPLPGKIPLFCDWPPVGDRWRTRAAHWSSWSGRPGPPSLCGASPSAARGRWRPTSRVDSKKEHKKNSPAQKVMAKEKVRTFHFCQNINNF